MPAQKIAVAIVQHEGKTLVGIRPEGSSLAGMHEFPGGKCETGEPPKTCAVRETQEETGLLVIPVDSVQTVQHSYDHGDVEISFWMCRLAEEKISQPKPPFTWVPNHRLTTLQFPEANKDIVQKLASQSQPRTAIIIVDHGSRKAASNEMLLQVVGNFEALGEHEIVEPAHMELAEPSIDQAFAKCVERGAERVIVFPYFLSPGRHWSEDIPSLTAAAAAKHTDIDWLVTAPFGLHQGMANIISDRIQQCTQIAHGQTANCDVCAGEGQCQFQSAAAT